MNKQECYSILCEIAGVFGTEAPPLKNREFSSQRDYELEFFRNQMVDKAKALVKLEGHSIAMRKATLAFLGLDR